MGFLSWGKRKFKNNSSKILVKEFQNKRISFVPRKLDFIMNKHIIHFQSGMGDSGGISNYISLLVKSRNLENISQKVLVQEMNKKTLKLYPKNQLIVFDTNYNFFNLKNKVSKVKKNLDNINFYIINSHALRSGLLAAFINLFYGKKYIHTNHGLRFTQKKGLMKIFFFLIEIFVLILSEEYICIRNSDYFLIKRFVPRILKEKIKIIRLHLDPNVNIIEVDTLSKFKSPFKIYGIGSLLDVKNPKLFINLISLLKKNNINVEAFWIGDGILKKELIALTKEKKLNINWMGHLDKDDVLRHLSKATYLLQTSLFEVYPTVVLESLLFGTPVITTNYFGVNELIQDFQNGVILKGNKFDETKIINMFRDENQYISMSNSCKNQFFNLHQNHKITADFYKKIYSKLMD